MKYETVEDIINQMSEYNGMAVCPIFCYTEDGGVDFTDLIIRLSLANERQKEQEKKQQQTEKKEKET